jgi:hypothetical protein
MRLNWRVGVAFGLGVAAGVVLKEAAQRTQNVAQRKLTHREREGTVSYDENLPETLERREPAPHEGQPRFGGTGAIGFSPAAAIKPSDT